MTSRRPSYPVVAVAGAATLAAWLITAPLSSVLRFWVTLLLVPLPALMILQARQLRAISELPRVPAYISSIVSLWILVIATLLVDRTAARGMASAGALDAIETAGVAGTLVVVAVAILFAFRNAGFREAAIVRELLPASARERALFVLLSLSAGIGEEIVFRGFLLTALTGATDSVTVAVVLSSLCFGVVHAYQSAGGALRAALLGALLAVPVVLYDTLLPSVIAHTTIDILSGIWLAKYLLR